MTDRYEDRLRARGLLISRTFKSLDPPTVDEEDWYVCMSVEERDTIADLVETYREISRFGNTTGGPTEEMWDDADAALAKLDGLGG